MIDHTGVTVSDVAKSKAFYSAALGPLGYGIIMEFEGAVGFGVVVRGVVRVHGVAALIVRARCVLSHLGLLFCGLVVRVIGR